MQIRDGAIEVYWLCIVIDVWFQYIYYARETQVISIFQPLW